KPCPVLISCGHDPLLFLAGGNEIRYGLSEYDYAAGHRGAPYEVIESERYGLPMPAHAEIVLEGAMHPGETMPEGPCGEFTGHAKQAALLAASCQSGSYLGRFVVVVDDDVDPTKLEEVIWAMSTRCDPAEDIDIVRRAWSGPLDPRLPKGTTWNSRGLIDACRPYDMLKDFPPVVKAAAELRERVRSKFEAQLKAAKIFLGT